MISFKEWLANYGPIPDDAGKGIIKQIKLLTGLAFKKKHGNYEAGGFDMSLNNGIFVLQGNNIPNFEKVVEYIKSKFGDVHTQRKEYINARGYGVPYQDEPPGSIEIKTNLTPLPSIQQFISFLTSSKKTQRDALNLVRQKLEARKVKINGRPQGMQLVKKMDITENLVRYQDALFLISVSTAYQVLDDLDAKNLMGFINLEMHLLRTAEVESWKTGDLSNPNG